MTESNFKPVLQASKIMEASQICSAEYVFVCSWIVVLQDCVELTKGASLSGLFSVVVFYVALAKDHIRLVWPANSWLPKLANSSCASS